MSEFNLRRPCEDCPFRTDIAPYLGKARVAALERELARGLFYCHKTTGPGDDDGDRVVLKTSQVCAGSMIVQEKMEQPGQMLRIAERLGMYDPTKLDMTAPVYDSFAAMRQAAPR